MSIQRMKHMVIALGLFERMSDNDLRQAFPKTSVNDIRGYLAECRERGYKYYPCSCEEQNPDGSCMGREEVK